MPLHPITTDCAKCGLVGTMVEGTNGEAPAVVHVVGDTVRYCRTRVYTDPTTQR